jgi:hypothetical protein
MIDTIEDTKQLLRDCDRDGRAVHDEMIATLQNIQAELASIETATTAHRNRENVLQARLGVHVPKRLPGAPQDWPPLWNQTRGSIARLLGLVSQ